MNKYIIVLSLSLLLIGCKDNMPNELTSNLSVTDQMFTNGANLKLEQAYVMSDSNTIPYLDTAKDSCFNESTTTVNINKFVAYNDTGYANLLFALSKNEIWNFSKSQSHFDTTYVEHGTGNSYFVVRNINEFKYNNITSSNSYTKRYFNANIKIDDPYSYRGNDNHTFNIEYIDKSKSFLSNLYLNVLTNLEGCASFNPGYVYFDTNTLYNITFQVSTPLLSNQVKAEIAKGNYTLYLYDGMTTFRIGNNLYIPRYDGYIYIGCVSNNGMVITYESKYYRFKFKIVK